MTDISPRVAGVVLAGGRSLRMGRDKALLSLAGETLLDRAVRRLSAQVDPVAVNIADDSAVPGLPCLADPLPGFQGPLAGVLAALIWAAGLPGPVSHVVSVPVDSPFFPADLAVRLMDALAVAATGPGTIAVATGPSGRQPVFAAWPVCLADDLDAFLRHGDMRKVGAFLGRHPLTEVDFPGIPAEGAVLDPFLNLNTPEEFAAAERLLTAAAP